MIYLAMLEDISKLATLASLIVGAIWTYLLFIQRRQKFPRVVLEHEVIFVPSDQNVHVIRVKVTVRNIGEVLVVLTQGFTRVQQLLPTNPITHGHQTGTLELAVTPGFREIPWPQIAETQVSFPEPYVEIEPHEHHEFLFDFALPAKTHVVSIHTHFANETRDLEGYPKQYGWSRTSHCNLRKRAPLTSAHYGTRTPA